MVGDYRHVDVRPLIFPICCGSIARKMRLSAQKAAPDINHCSIIHASRSGGLIFALNLCVEVYLHEKEGLGARNVTDTR